MAPPPRILPHNLNAEASVLGGVLLRRAALAEPAVSALDVLDFYGPKHQAVWMAMRNLETTSQPIDPITVEAELQRLGKLDAAGGLAFLGELALITPSADRVADYAAIVGKLSTRRKVIQALGEAQDRLYCADEDDEDLNGEAAKIYALSLLSRVEVKSASSARPMGAIVKKRIGQLVELDEARARGEKPITGIPSGVAALDAKLGGYQRGIVTVIGGRPGMGKSSTMLAACMAATAAGHGVHVFAFEDGEESLADRAMSAASGVPATAIRAFDIRQGEMRQLGEAMNSIIARKNWIVEEKPSLYVDDICRAVLRDLVANGTEEVVIDYVQLLKGPRGNRYRPSEREQEISDIGTELMKFARDYNLAVLLGSQLNRDCERRDDKRPVKSDMRGSGTLEERAKAVVLLYRGSENGPAVQGIDEQYVDAHGHPCPGYLPLDDEWAQVIELILDKNSNGPTGRVRAHWHGPTMRVS